MDNEHDAGASTADLVSPLLGQPQQAPEVAARAEAVAQLLGGKVARGYCTCNLPEADCHREQRADGDTSAHDSRVEQLIADGEHTTCRECDSLNVGDHRTTALVARACWSCGEDLGIACKHCDRRFLIEQLDAGRRCEDCAAAAVRIAKREKRDALIECYGAPRRGVEVY